MDHEPRGDRAEFNPDPKRMQRVLLEARWQDLMTGESGIARDYFERDALSLNEAVRGVGGELFVQARKRAVKQGEAD